MMFKKSKRKIVASIMLIFVILWLGTLSLIYGSSYLEMSKHNTEMLRAYSDMYILPQSATGRGPGMPVPDPGKPAFVADSPMFQLSTFYSVALSETGLILDIKNDRPEMHTNKELEELSRNAFKSKKQTGTLNSLVFYKADKNGYTLITFMDNVIINQSASTLLRYTLIFGGIALIVFFFISILLAKKIVQPLEESYHKQKQFISDAGHELKTPVTVIGTNAEILSREYGDNQWLSNIQYENQRMGILINQLLELARTENTSPKMERIYFSYLCTGEVLPLKNLLILHFYSGQ